jgi:prepilin-type N-terminal cleavage/methylation domain-containing protein/prepilin-type processing-associated H-X9-DG protein
MASAENERIKLGVKRSSSVTAKRRCAGPRKGFTLTELLVVSALIGLAIGATLSTLQTLYEQSRQMACKNNLYQLIIAVHNYELMHGIYPAGTIDVKGPILSQQSGYHHNWIGRILPYIEQGNAYRAIDWKAGVYAKTNGSVRAIDVALLRCPSIPLGHGAPISTYAAVHHDVEAPIDIDNHGVFFLNSRVRYDDIWDGASFTAFIGEKFPDPADLGWMSGTRATLRNMGSPLSNAGINGLGRTPAWSTPPVDYTNNNPLDDSLFDAFDFVLPTDTVRAGDKDDPAYEEKGRSAPMTAPPAASQSRSRAQRRSVVGGFGGPHSNGVYFAFGDGSVRFVRTNIAPAIRLRMANRADGDLID